ncbi:DUF4081 domain-containing GNAT family N-acetyltransferase [Arthrobacter sp. 35W]|uniref:GNAT family N-acetyltransferase n=1 Tax=Arthrobacter sp. 35W TaxID=1132441 RepID=UPI00047D05E4|nr:DUF4081 domain-containing GNAT family N-acetyltransferase [Arthrobacter sp. 35W]
MLSRVAPWSLSRRSLVQTPVHKLVHEDTEALRALVAADPVANVFLASQLEATGTAVPDIPGAVALGYFDGDKLRAACWVGSNVVPVGANEVQARAFGQWLVSSRRTFASIFGPAEAVLPLFAELEADGMHELEVRANQPLLALAGPPAIPANELLAPSLAENFPQILTAAAAMFEEEVGYSPFLGGPEHYRRRVQELIRNGHSLSHCGHDGQVIFKADLGAVSSAATQVQGVWMNPAYRGLGMSAGYMAAVVLLAQKFAPITSLYVNAYNTRARAVYERVGFEQVGTFATVLF